MGHLLLDLDDPRLASACFRRLTQVRPRDAKAWLNRGVAECARGRHADGIRCFRRSLDLNAANVAAMHNLALALADDGRLAEAARAARAGLVAAPGDANLRRLAFRLRLLRALSWVGVGRRL